MSKATIGKALNSNNLHHVRSYLKKVHDIDVVAKGKRKHPSKQQLRDRIHGMKNVTRVLVDLQRMQQLNKNGKQEDKEDADHEDEEESDDFLALVDDDDDEHDKEDDVMDMLKAELALRGKTTNGNSYPLLVRRLIYSLRNE